MKNTILVTIILLLIFSCKKDKDDEILHHPCSNFDGQGVNDNKDSFSDYRSKVNLTLSEAFYNDFYIINNNPNLSTDIIREDTIIDYPKQIWKLAGGYNEQGFPGGGKYYLHMASIGVKPFYYSLRITNIDDSDDFTNRPLIFDKINPDDIILIDRDEQEYSFWVEVDLPNDWNGRLALNCTGYDENGIKIFGGGFSEEFDVINQGGNPSFIGEWVYCKSFQKNINNNSIYNLDPFDDLEESYDTLQGTVFSEDLHVIYSFTAYYNDTLKLNANGSYTRYFDPYYGDSTIVSPDSYEPRAPYFVYGAYNSIKGVWKYYPDGNALRFADESYETFYRWYLTDRFFDEAKVVNNELILGKSINDSLFNIRVYKRLN